MVEGGREREGGREGDLNDALRNQCCCTLCMCLPLPSPPHSLLPVHVFTPTLSSPQPPSRPCVYPYPLLPTASFPSMCLPLPSPPHSLLPVHVINPSSPPTASFPSSVMEYTEDEVKEWLSPKDFGIGKTINILGRKFIV